MRDEMWVEGHFNSGTHHPEAGGCPLCGGRILYNGNYFCEDFGCTFEGVRYGGPCDWGLPHPATSKIDRAICDALGVDYL